MHATSQTMGETMQPNYPPAMPTKAPPKRKRRGLAVVLAVLSALAVLSCAGVFAAVFAGSGRPKGSTVLTVPDSGLRPFTSAPIATGDVLMASDVKLSVRKTSNECFGSAGCNVEYRITATLTRDPKEDESYLITYQMTGLTDGATEGSFETSGATYTVPTGFGQTKSRGSKIGVKVTAVEKLGL